jgi:hypothetical protein
VSFGQNNEGRYRGSFGTSSGIAGLVIVKRWIDDRYQNVGRDLAFSYGRKGATHARRSTPLAVLALDQTIPKALSKSLEMTARQKNAREPVPARGTSMTAMKSDVSSQSNQNGEIGRT